MYIIAQNIISSLGFSTEENYAAVKQGISGIKFYEAGTFDLPEPFMASLIDKERLSDEFSSSDFPKPDFPSFKNLESIRVTDLEKAAILSVYTANKESQIDLSSEKTIFILSTTKGNVDLLSMNNEQLTMNNSVEKQNHYSLFINHCSLFLWHTAEIIAQFFGNKNTPIVVSNACISGAAAQIVAKRALQSGKYDHAVVVGVDFLSKFIISGFQAFKALSLELCKPFDKDRCGLNLGEAAGTMIMSNEQLTMNNEQLIMNNGFRLVAGAVRNDATHISAPSRIGEGSSRALDSILNLNRTPHTTHRTPHTSHSSPLISNIAFINVHGTATPYNDAMEAHAIHRAGLSHIPVNGLKSYFGHTLGAAGVVESIISMQALGEGIILKTLGFENNEQLTINNEQFSLLVTKENMKTDKNCFIKMMSGFGGVNAALLFATNYTN